MLEKDTTSALISAENVVSIDGITRVWAVITPPNYSTDAGDDTFLSLPVIDLEDVGDNRFEKSYDNFAIQGTYAIAIFASDNDGDISLPKQTSVTQFAEGIVLKGDINGDQAVDLADAVIALKASAGKDAGTIRSGYAASDADVSGDGKVGLEEIIYILAKIAG